MPDPSPPPPSGLTLICAYDKLLLNVQLNARITSASHTNQEIMKVRKVIPHIGPIPIVIPLTLFIDLLRDPVFPRGLTHSQSYVPILTNNYVGIRSAANIGKNGDI